MTTNNHMSRNGKKRGKGKLYTRGITPSLKQRANRYCLKLISQINKNVTIPRTMEKTATSKLKTVFLKLP